MELRNNPITSLVNSSTPNVARNAQTVGIFTATIGAVTVASNQLSNIGKTSAAAPTTSVYHYVSGAQLLKE